MRRDNRISQQIRIHRSIVRWKLSDFDDAIAHLKEGQGYARIKLYGFDGDILTVTEQVFQADHSAADASLYAMDDGKARFLGYVSGNGSAFPLRIEDGIIYGGDNHHYDTYFLSANNGIPSMMMKDSVYDDIESGDGTFGGFQREDNDSESEADFTGGRAEFDALINAREKTVIGIYRD